MTRTRTGTFALIGAVLAAAASVALAWPASAATSYFVATSGNDANPGTSVDAPFRTIQKCASVAVAGDTCQIRAGVYRETVTPANSGTAAGRIVFQPYNNESVTVSGADPVTGWTRHSGEIYAANVTLPVSGETSDVNNRVTPGAVSANQVFVDAVMTGEAQWPNGSTDPSHQATAEADAGTSVGTVIDAALPAGVDFTGAIEHVVGGPAWSATANIVTASSAGQFTVRRYCGDPNCNRPGAKYYLTGGNRGLQLLDAPGEWWYDWTARRLYLWAPGGGSPAARTVEAKRRHAAFNLSGRSNVTVAGLKIFSATVLTSPTSSNIVLDGIDAAYVSHALTLPNDPQDVAGCGTWCSGATSTGIILDGSNHTLRNSTVAWSSGNGVSLAGSNMTLVNNLIHDVNYLGGYPSGINFGFRGYGTVTHNTLYNSGRFLISLNPGTQTAYTHKSRISYNNLYNFGLQTRDLGAIYICCHSVDAQQSSIDHNWIHDTAVADKYSTGVFLDDGASGFVVHHNVVWDTGRYGLKLNATGSGSDGSSSNDLYNNTVGPGVGYSEGGHLANATGTALQNNLWAHGSVTYERTPPNATITANSSNTVRPRFVNPAVRDYRLQPNSPAVDAGTAVAGVTDGFRGRAPDQGAYETGGIDWTAGCGHARCRSTTDAYLGIRAGSYSSQSGTQLENSVSQGSNVAHIHNGDYTAYSGVDLSGAASLVVQVASAQATPGSIEARLGSPTGPVLATCQVPGTGGWQTWTTISCPTSAASGTHTLYLVYRNAANGGSLFNVAWFRIATAPVTTINPYLQVEAEQYDAQVGTGLGWTAADSGTDVNVISNNDHTAYAGVAFGASSPRTLSVRTSSQGSGGIVQARLGSPTGATVATCTVPATGSWQTFVTTSCPVTGATGTHTLYLVYRGGSGNLLNLDWFRFAR
ncbi:MAG TPA: carbohydrate-binding protein [Micromonosporaceae bacterium]|nr:carbohydrate-binding protein [Micromonosporaceae bacterium]